MRGRRIGICPVVAGCVAAVLMCEWAFSEAGPAQPPAVAPAPETKVVTVSSVREFLEAIGPDRTIQMKLGTYILKPADAGDRKFTEWEKVNDGFQLKVRNLSNLTILGIDKEPTKLLVSPSYAYVLTFSKCANLRLANLVIGHGPEPGACSGGVLQFDSCKTVNLDKLDLFGCGIEGLYLTDVEGLSMTDSAIHDCTEGAVRVSGSEKLRFLNSNFINNKGYDTFFAFQNSVDVRLEKCLIRDNTNPAGGDRVESLFAIGARSKVTLKDCRIEKNRIGILFQVEPIGALNMSGGSITGNDANSLALKGKPDDEDKPVITLEKVDIKDNEFHEGTFGENEK